MYDDVLVPTDGSDPAAVAVEQGIAIADRFDATLHVLYVVDVGTEMSAAAVGTVAEELTETMTEVAAETIADAVADAEAADVDTEEAIIEGLPSQAISSYCDDHDVDLVVMGASGHSGLEAALLGRTTDRVAHTVDTSVLVAR